MKSIYLASFFLRGAVSALAADCVGSFDKITANTWVSGAQPGWNLGNTLDAIPTEGSWGNTADFSTFDDIKRSGFKSVRIPGMLLSRVASDKECQVVCMDRPIVNSD